MVKNLKLCFLLLFLVFIASCGKKLIYFQEKDDSKNKYNNIEVSKPENPRDHIIEAGDILGLKNNSNSIEVSTLLSGIANGLNVQENGTIFLPYSGSIKISGKSISEAQNIISAELSKYIVNPTIELFLISFRITVLGEIGSPGIKNSPADKMTILDALSLSGDLGSDARRSNIKVIRQVGEKKITIFMDMTSLDVFRSETFYLKSNDIVYIEPLSRRFLKENIIYVSVILTLVNTLVIFFRL